MNNLNNLRLNTMCKKSGCKKGKGKGKGGK